MPKKPKEQEQRLSELTTIQDNTTPKTQESKTTSEPVNTGILNKRDALRIVVNLLCEFDVSIQDIVDEYNRICTEKN